MKANIHPDYHTITVVMTDGTKYETRSTWGKPGDVLQLDVDPKTHPAWVGGVNLRKTGQMEKFTNKFAFLDKGASTAKKETKQEEKPTVKAEVPVKKEAKEAKKEGKPAEAKKAEGAKKEVKKEEKPS